ncbi:cell division protein FtsZ, partial [Chloroflexota bacterium]
VKELGGYLRQLAPEAVIRNGDYPREEGVINVTVILSELRDVEKLRQYYQESVDFMQDDKRKQLESESKLKEMEDASKDIPSL